MYIACTCIIAVNGEKFQSHAVTLTLIPQCSIKTVHILFSHATNYLSFMFLDRLLFELLCVNTHKQTHKHTHICASVTETHNLSK